MREQIAAYTAGDCFMVTCLHIPRRVRSSSTILASSSRTARKASTQWEIRHGREQSIRGMSELTKHSESWWGILNASDVKSPERSRGSGSL